MERIYFDNKCLKTPRLNVVCVFPENYEYGICNLGHQVIYSQINKDKEVFANRIYCDEYFRQAITA